MKSFFQIVTILMLSFSFPSCKSETPAETEEEHHDDHEAPNSTSLTQEQMQSIKIELGSIEKKQLTASLKANGILKVPNQNRAFTTALLGGVVKSINVQTGNTVHKGQVIATIANTAFITMQEEFLNVSSRLALAELQFKRQKELQAGNAGTLRNYQESESELSGLKAKRSALEKQLELIGINSNKLTGENIQSVVSITSPISGAVSNVMVNIGSYVDANKPLAEVVDNSQLHLDLYVYEKDLQKLKVGQTIHFTLTNNPGKEYDATVFGISNTFEENTKAIAIHAKVDGDKSGLIDGMSITALVSLENATVDAVPADAIVNSGGQDYIFIVTNENEGPDHPEDAGKDETRPAASQATHFERIPVRKGTTDIGYSEITLLKEIPDNAQVAVKGAFFILAKMTNTGEHEH